MKNTGDGRRVARVERELQQQIASFLISGFKTPLPGIVTVTLVRMPADLRSAKVYISVIGADTEVRDKAVDILQERAFEVQKFIGQNLKMRYCPKLTFYADEMTDKVLKIEGILHDLKQQKNKSDSEE